MQQRAVPTRCGVYSLLTYGGFNFYGRGIPVSFTSTSLCKDKLNVGANTGHEKSRYVLQYVKSYTYYRTGRQ